MTRWWRVYTQGDDGTWSASKQGWPTREGAEEAADKLRAIGYETTVGRDGGPMDPPPGSYAATARMLVECGLMDGDEADRWKDEMKEGDMR